MRLPLYSKPDLRFIDNAFLKPLFVDMFKVTLAFDFLLIPLSANVNSTTLDIQTNRNAIFNVFDMVTFNIYEDMIIPGFFLTIFFNAPGKR